MIKKIEGLNLDKGHNLYFNDEYIKPLKDELETFISEESQMNTLDFSKKVMHSQEIKNNNNIEGYSDDISSIEEVIRNSNSISDKDKKNRIINLYKGYKYILQKPEINKENLRKLYKILSYNLLSNYDLKNMGEFYRKGEVFIYFSDNVAVPPDKGVSYELLDDMMDKYFKFLSSEESIDTLTDYYIKSQIAHFYFVYIHPYFDINGRSARTTSMWYLLNNEAYPYIIFNRAIGNSKNIYYKEIRNAKTSHNLTSFIEYLMINVKKELEKEYVIQAIKSASNEKLSSIEFSTILDILSMNGLKTLKDFSHLYNMKNDKKRVIDIHKNMIEPLLEKEVITKIRDTNGMYYKGCNNFVFELKTDKLDLDKNKIRRLNIK
ncbi:MAG: Fic family protein [Bacilli bacterium]